MRECSTGAVVSLQVHPTSDNLLLIGHADGMLVEWGAQSHLRGECRC